MGDIRALGYLAIDTTDLDRWRTLAFDVLDLGEGAESDENTLTCAPTNAPTGSSSAAATPTAHRHGLGVRDGRPRRPRLLREHGISTGTCRSTSAGADRRRSLDSRQPTARIFPARESTTRRVHPGTGPVRHSDSAWTSSYPPPTTRRVLLRDNAGLSHARSRSPAPGMPPLLSSSWASTRHHSFAVMPAPRMIWDRASCSGDGDGSGRPGHGRTLDPGSRSLPLGVTPTTDGVLLPARPQADGHRVRLRAPVGKDTTCCSSSPPTATGATTGRQRRSPTIPFGDSDARRGRPNPPTWPRTRPRPDRLAATKKASRGRRTRARGRRTRPWSPGHHRPVTSAIAWWCLPVTRGSS